MGLKSPMRKRGVKKSVALTSVSSLLILQGMLFLAGPAFAANYSGGFSPTIINFRADLNGDSVVNGRDDSNAFFGDTHIIDGYLDCNAWGSANDGSAGDGVINIDDDCTLIGYDGSVDGVTIQVIDGEFRVPNGPLPTVYNASDPDNNDVGDSDFAWSTIDGRVDSHGDEVIDAEDCHLGLIGATVDAGLGDPHDGADVLGDDSANTNPCGFGFDPADDSDGLVDWNSDGVISALDTCTNGCFFRHNLTNGFVQDTGSPAPVPADIQPPAGTFSGGFSPTIVGSRADLNGDGVANGMDDANAFYGDTHIIDGYLDCDNWAAANDGTAGDGVINADDDCELIGYDGSPDGVTIVVLDGEFEVADGPLPTVFNASDPDNNDVGDSDFAWSTIGGRVDSSGDEFISAEDCHFGIRGTTNDTGLGDPTDGFDVLGNDSANSNPCGFATGPADSSDGLVDTNNDGAATASDDCNNGCFYGHDVQDGYVMDFPTISVGDVAVNESAGTATFTLTRTGSSGSSVTVSFATANGTATAGSDYTPTSGTRTFVAGDNTETVVVTILNDSVFEPTENFFLNLSGPTNHAVISDNEGQATIADNDSAPPTPLVPNEPGENLGGVLVGSPDVAAWGPNRLDVFARGTDNQLYHRWWDGSTWNGWESLGGALASDPTAVAWGPNRLDVFYRGTDAQLWHRWWDGSTWNGPEALGGTLVGGPDATSWSSNRIDVFVRGTDNGLWHRWWDGSSWNGYEGLGGTLTADPGASSWGPNRIDVFVRGTDNGMWHRWWDGIAWRGYENLGGTLVGGPDATSWSSNRIDVFVRGTDNQLYHRWWDGVAWRGWEGLSGNLTSDPTAASWTFNRIDAFYRGPGGELRHRWWDGRRWNP